MIANRALQMAKASCRGGGRGEHQEPRRKEEQAYAHMKERDPCRAAPTPRLLRLISSRRRTTGCLLASVVNIFMQTWQVLGDRWWLCAARSSVVLRTG